MERFHEDPFASVEADAALQPAFVLGPVEQGLSSALLQGQQQPMLAQQQPLGAHGMPEVGGPMQQLLMQALHQAPPQQPQQNPQPPLPPTYPHSVICWLDGSEAEAKASMIARVLHLHYPSEANSRMAQWQLGEMAARLQPFNHSEPLIPPGKPGYDASPITSQPTQRKTFFQLSTRVDMADKADKCLLVGFKKNISGLNVTAPSPIGSTGLYTLTRSGFVTTGSDG